MGTALIVEDDADALRSLDAWVQKRSMTTRLASSLAEARERLSRGPVDLALIDLVLPDGSGFDLAEEIELSTRLIYMSGLTRPPESGGARAVEFLPKPLNLERLDSLLSGARDSRGGDSRRLGRFIGSSPAMREFYEELGRIARVDGTVFIHGETGVGKELAARHVHELSTRARACFEAINCGALAQNLVESELFGHERGSFTGAHKRHLGVFERGTGGTVFLDEVTEMPLELQVKLLRVLETGTLRRVGGSEDITVDVRLVVATNRDPARAVADGKLREDLFYRLYVLPVQLPPLRDRGQDILELAEGFLADWAELHGTEKSLTEEARALLLEHDWPGNVRELRNTIYRAYHVSDAEIGASDVRLMPRPGASAGGFDARLGGSGFTAGMPMREVERLHLLATLERCGGNKRRAAKALGISLKTVYNKLKSYREDGADSLEDESED